MSGGSQCQASERNSGGIRQNLAAKLVSDVGRTGELVFGFDYGAIRGVSDQGKQALRLEGGIDLTGRNEIRVSRFGNLAVDGGTITSALVPWNTCGAFMAATLGVATQDYLWFCIFNMASPLISYAYTLVNFKVELIEPAPQAAASV